MCAHRSRRRAPLQRAILSFETPFRRRGARVARIALDPYRKGRTSRPRTPLGPRFSGLRVARGIRTARGTPLATSPCMTLRRSLIAPVLFTLACSGTADPATDNPDPTPPTKNDGGAKDSGTKHDAAPGVD